MTQVSSPADRPWSGQAQCVVSTTGTNYQDEQTHTWRLTGAPPVIVGSTRQWPAVWTVQGKGRRAFASTTARSAPATAVDSWTNDSPDVDAPISIWEVPGLRGANRLRIGSQHGQKTVGGGVRVTTSAGQTVGATLWEWQFPMIEDAATTATLSGTSTRTFPVGPGWQRPFGAVTTETCNWHFSRDGSIAPGSPQAAATATIAATASTQPTLSTGGGSGTIETPTGGRGRTTLLPQPRAITTAGFAGAGAYGAAPPRTIVAAGFTASGAFNPPPRTITATGWTARGQ